MTGPLTRQLVEIKKKAKRLGALDLAGEFFGVPLLQEAADRLSPEQEAALLTESSAVAIADFGLLADAAVDYYTSKISAARLNAQYHKQVRSIVERLQGRAGSAFRLVFDRAMGDNFDRYSEAIGSMVTAAQNATGAITSAALSNKLGVQAMPPDPSITLRNGIDKVDEYRRPFRVAAKALNDGMTREEAIELGIRRLNSLTATDIQMARVRQAQITLTSNGIRFYRRVPTSPRPCSLCEIASSNIYATNGLMPIHTHCSCDIEPIDIETVDDTQADVQRRFDAIAKLPAADRQQQGEIEKLREEDAPISEYRDLVEVREHGEVGPFLTWKNQKWVGPEQLSRSTAVGLEGSRIPRRIDPEVDRIVGNPLKLPWDGPTIAYPVESPAVSAMLARNFNQTVNDHWESTEFDDYKWDIRLGVRRAIRDGYRGLEEEADYVGIDLDDAARFQSGELDLMDASPEWLDLEGREIAARAFHSTPTEEEWYRGMKIRAEDLDELAVGDELSLPASSFGGKTTATKFATGQNKWVSGDAPQDGIAVVLELEPGAKLAHVGFEKVGFGTFEITDIVRYGDSDGLAAGLPKEIRIKHRSLREYEPPTSSAVGAESLSRQEYIFTPGLERSRVPTQLAGVDDVALPWSGPDVAKPTFRGGFDEYSDKLWQATLFDYFKNDMRQGVRDVQTAGYKGLIKERKELGVDTSKKAIAKDLGKLAIKDLFVEAAKAQGKPYDPNVMESFHSPNVLKLAGREIAARVINSEPIDYRLYRGMQIAKSDLDELVVGDELSLPASSFVDDRSIAQNFARGSNFWVSRDAATGPDADYVFIEVEPGAKATKVGDSGYPAEHVSFGRFEIVKLERRELTTEPGKFLTKLRLRHKSVREYIPTPAARRTAANVVEEYNIVPMSGPRRRSPRRGIDPSTVVEGEIPDYGRPLSVAAQLRARYPKLDVDISDRIDNAAFLSVARQFDALKQKYPQANIRQLTDGEMSANSSRYAEADVWQEGLAIERDLTAIEIRLNRSRFSNRAQLEADNAEDVAVRFHPPNGGADAAAAILTHEFAHGLDATGSYRASQEASKVLKQKFIELNPEWAELPPMPSDYSGTQRAWELRWPSNRDIAYKEWLRTQLTGYSFNRDGSLNPTEALANAFQHVELSPSTASEAEKALHDLLIRRSTEPAKSLNAPGWVGSARQQRPAAVVDKLERKRNKTKDKPNATAGVSNQQRRQDQRRTEGSGTRRAANVRRGSTNRRRQPAADDVKQRAARAFAEQQLKAQDLMAKAKSVRTTGVATPDEMGYGSVLDRITGGITVQPIYKVKADGTLQLRETAVDKDGKIKMMLPVIDQKATWDSISDEVLKQNWRAGLRSAEQWAREAGSVWYDDLRELVTNLADTYRDSFRERYGLDLTPDLVAGIISSYSTNNSWVGNLVGVQKFLAGTFGNGVPSTFKDGQLDPKAIHFQNEDWGVKPLLEYLKAGKGTVTDYFAENKDAPKPYNFVRSILGDPEAATIDRWVTRIMLHTNDYWLADTLWSSSSQADGRYGFDRMKRIIQEISQEPEFAGLTAYDIQAIPWVHVNGPAGAVAKLEVSSLYDASLSETPNVAVQQALREEGIRRGWLTPDGKPVPDLVERLREGGS